MTTGNQVEVLTEIADMLLSRVDSLHVKFNKMSSQLRVLYALEVNSTGMEIEMAKTLDEMISAQQQAVVAIQRNSDLGDSIKGIADAYKAQVQSLKDQLAAAVAAGVDPAKLQTLSDAIDAALAGDLANGDKLQAIALANTEAQP